MTYRIECGNCHRLVSAEAKPYRVFGDKRKYLLVEYTLSTQEMGLNYKPVCSICWDLLHEKPSHKPTEFKQAGLDLETGD